MRILIASSEVVPFAKTGGLADVAGALPKSIRKLGHDVAVLMPCYRSVDRQKFHIELVGSFDVIISDASEKADLFVGKLPGSDVPVYLIYNEKYFNRQNLYGDDGKEYVDNDERFVFFQKAVFVVCKYLNFAPDVIHCNDWQTGLIPVYLNTLFANDSFFSKTSTIFTIHNLAYQGLFDPDKALKVTGLPPEVYSYNGLEFWSKFSFIKGGLVYADLITTVSDKYSQEIQTTEYGCGLDGLLQSRSSDLFGVINGIDYSIWDPGKDKHIVENYHVGNLVGKLANKKALLAKYNLKYKPNTPVIGAVSRLADQKGFDLIEEIVESLMKKNLQLVILGTGEPKYHQLFTELSARYPEKIGIALKYDGMLAQLIYAGSDMFLMPSRFEPCGLGQLIALKYGTIPVVRETGGLADTIVDYDAARIFEPKKTNGFVFTEYKSEKLLERIERSLKIYRDKKAWTTLMLNAMRYDFSWKKSALRYIELYEKALAKP